MSKEYQVVGIVGTPQKSVLRFLASLKEDVGVKVSYIEGADNWINVVRTSPKAICVVRDTISVLSGMRIPIADMTEVHNGLWSRHSPWDKLRKLANGKSAPVPLTSTIVSRSVVSVANRKFEEAKAEERRQLRKKKHAKT